MTINNKEDRRVRKTKKALREALVELLNEKSLQHVTVRELTDKADIHRSTFYANFKDVYDLHYHMEDTIIKEINDIISIDYTFSSKAFFKVLVDYINKNRQISRLFFGGNINTTFFERITDLFKNACIDTWHKEYNVTNLSEEMDYYVQFCLSGGLGIIGMWVSGGFEYPVEKLVEILSETDSAIAKLSQGV